MEHDIGSDLMSEASNMVYVSRCQPIIVISLCMCVCVCVCVCSGLILSFLQGIVVWGSLLLSHT